MKNIKHKASSISTKVTKDVAEAKAKLDPNMDIDTVNSKDVSSEVELLSLGIRSDTGKQVIRENNKDIVQEFFLDFIKFIKRNKNNIEFEKINNSFIKGFKDLF
jgi:hypothetical protein